MKSLVDFFDCGRYSHRLNKDAGDFVVTNFSDISEKIIPFFDKYPLEGSKNLDFRDFCKIAEIVKSKDHLTVSGLEKIRLIKAGMNRGRYNA